MIIPMTAIFAAVTAVLMLFLAARVSSFRLKYSQGLGVNDNPAFEAAVRAHGNLVEHAPIVLIMLALGELNGLPVQWIYWTGMAFIAGRLLHAWGMVRGVGGPHPARMLGILLTWAVMAVLCVLLVWNVLQAY